MKLVYGITDAKSRFSSLVAKAEAGEEVIIARAGKPVVRLVPIGRVRKKRADRKPGFMKGRVCVGPDFDDPLPDDTLRAFYKAEF